MNARNIRVVAADGTASVIDVTRPDTADRVRAVVTRTPYGRANHRAEGDAWAARGFAYVVADVRGRYDSDGVWELYRNERSDGATLIDWITAQPWSDGTVIPFGGSYSGYTAWAMAVERPDATVAVVSAGPSMTLARTKFSPSGVLRLAEHASWWSERADSRTSRDGHAREFFGRRPDALHRLPVLAIADYLGAELPGWSGVVERGPHHLDDERITDAELATITIPTFHLGGWFDLLLPETLHQWGLVASAAKRLVIGPWDHDLGFSDATTLGDLDFGAHSAISIGAEITTWLADVLSGTVDPKTASTVFVVGTNRWEHGTGWPAASVEQRWYRHGTSLTRERIAPTRSGILEIQHRVADPFPSYPAGRDRTRLGERTDALRAHSAPLGSPLRIDGSVTVSGQGSSDAGVSDWIVRLVEHTVDGRVFELTVGETTTTGEQFTVVLNPIAATLPAGSMLGIEITAADFPRLAQNIGAPGPERYSTKGVPLITQHLHQGADADLTVVIPVRPDIPEPTHAS